MENTEQITNEMRCRIFAAYWGSKVKAIHAAFVNGEKIFKYLELTDHSVSDGCNWFMLDNCQLILSDLSEITDEHAAELGKIFGYSGSGLSNCAHWGRYWINTQKSGNGWAYRKAIAAVDKLRELGYDCGYGSIPSLIQAGIAIKK